jgi:hypothetical protein
MNENYDAAAATCASPLLSTAMPKSVNSGRHLRLDIEAAHAIIA